ncbi:MAG: DUF222 domain-containing protein [Rhodoglobus sp.]
MAFTDSFATTAHAVMALGQDAAALAALPDEQLVTAHSLLSAHRQHAETFAAWLAGEIARRSARDTGYSGLAQQRGFGSAEALIQATTPTTRADAHAAVQLGALMSAVGSATPLPAWESAIAEALTGGLLAPRAAEAIRHGLSGADDAAPATALAAASADLIAAAPSLPLDELRRRARAERDRLDERGIAERERARHEQRYLKRWVRDDGMYQGSFLLDPESGRQVFAALDDVIAPRRGGPRFVDAAARAREDALTHDPRTDEQLLADALVEMTRLAVEADPGHLFGSRRPAVRVVVTEHTLRHDGGHGYLEGDGQPVSRATIDRRICDAGIVGVKFDDHGACVDLGRTQRLFTERQRTGLAVRDGGCIFPDCSRPPSWCEAHHIEGWHRDNGRTDLADGVLLCRHHHMLVHNNGWRILREGARYFLKPPRSRDPEQQLIPMSSRSPVMRELGLVGAR